MVNVENSLHPFFIRPLCKRRNLKQLNFLATDAEEAGRALG